MTSMRDTIFNQVFEYAKTNRNTFVLMTDFPTAAFDRFRTELPGQFINTGISEQNTILVASGLAMNGKKVFVTGIAPFITMRCFEQIRLYPADMNLDITIVGVGAGFGYNNAGATHHAVEDIGILRTLPNMKLYTPSSNRQAKSIAQELCSNSLAPAYIRTERAQLDELYSESPGTKETGFVKLHKAAKTTIITSGYVLHTALRAANMLKSKGIEVGLIDAYRLPIDERGLLSELCECKQVITVEEHVKHGGLGAYICELAADYGTTFRIRRFDLGLTDGLYHKYGTRDEMLADCGISAEAIVDAVLEDGR